MNDDELAPHMAKLINEFAEAHEGYPPASFAELEQYLAERNDRDWREWKMQQVNTE
jgi:hypothetical protein